MRNALYLLLALLPLTAIAQTAAPAPTNLQATIKGTEVDLSWIAPAPDPKLPYEGYNILRDGVQIVGGSAPALAATVTGYADVGVAIGSHTYQVNFWACPATGSCLTTSANASVTANVTGTTVVTAPITANLTWTAPTTNTDGSALTDLTAYRVYRAAAAFTTASAGVLLTTVTAPTVAYNDPISAAGSYYYGVSALNKSGVESTLASGATLGLTVTAAPVKTTPGAPAAAHLACSAANSGGLQCTLTPSP